MKIFSKINKCRWELAKKLKDTPHIIIRITTRCNLKCSYCSIRTVCKIPSDLKELPPEYWIKEMDKFDIITISGGDPSVYRDVHKIINALVKKKKLVRVGTNLVDITEFKKVIPSWRVYFMATFHRSEMTVNQRSRFKENYKEMSKKYTIVSKEMRHIGDNTPPYFNKSKIYWLKESREELPTPGYFPDGSIEEGEAC